ACAATRLVIPISIAAPVAIRICMTILYCVDGPQRPPVHTLSDGPVLPPRGVAVPKILEHFGCKVFFPDAQTCCGQPFFNNGFHPEAKELAKRWIQIFEPYEYVVTPSGSCCAMVREQFHELLAHDHAWEHGLHHVLGRTYEFVEFLDK